MIKFPCTCGFSFEMPDEMAGVMIQCPRCRKLVDVPTLSDLNELDSDGTIKVQPLQIHDEPDRADQLRHVFGPKHDENGEEIDLRTSFEEILEAGGEEIPLELADEIRPGAPKYDPETGELIEPLGLKAEQARRVLPVGSSSSDSQKPAPPPPTLSYATRVNDAAAPLPWWWIPIAMVQLGNAAVIGVIFIAHLVAAGGTYVIAWGFWFTAFVLVLIWVALMAHWGNVVEETGPMERDELPPPMRGMSWSEDIFIPFGRLLLSTLYCYWPLMLFGGRHALGDLLLWAGGTFIFPAVFLTTCTSGSWNNLRPDRVLGVIGVCGWGYALSLLLCLTSFVLYWSCFFAANSFLYLLGARENPNPLWALSIPLLLPGVCIMHLFCWHLGLLYRRHHDRFPWILQHHISTRKTPLPLPPRRRRSYVQRTSAEPESNDSRP